MNDELKAWVEANGFNVLPGGVAIKHYPAEGAYRNNAALALGREARARFGLKSRYVHQSRSLVLVLK